ncbi:nif11-like leader peptide domain protein [Synechococcus sp. BIOS-E4-1]|uniref:Nif11-like leader peptide family natural product precursor n=1 Tax=Synechococcus sp. BIOS-E4-1 TaxID=1400864 RepID=UPI001644248E|nr:Nif11-like leader peptide family natural product precursor [Synechococcus sp. BIOS-E4-1]QNI55216.1 nif11-like leader peptide domain protein [Synechococcus sp. BIOS-E4-1]
MSEEQLKAFLEKVKGDTSLQLKLKAASDADGVVAIAKDAGFEFSADNLKRVFGPLEISDKELEIAAGGEQFTDIKYTCPEVATINDIACKGISDIVCTGIICP